MAIRKIFPTVHFSYGWYVLASAVLILFLNSGTRYCFSVTLKPMIEELGWSRGLISSAFFLNMTVFSLSIVAAGRVYDRYGPKWVIVAATLFLSAGYSLVSLTRSVWQFYVFYGVFAAVGLGGTSMALMSALVGKWFQKWRGLAISLAISGNCLGQFVLVPLFTVSTLRHGWRVSYLAAGLAMLVVNMLLALFVIREHPESVNSRSLAHEQRGRSERRKDPLPTGPVRDSDLKGALRTRSFWLFLAAMFVCGSGDYLVSTHLIAFVTDRGIGATTAGNMLGWFGLMSLGGVLIAGPATDVIGNKIPLAFTFLFRLLLFLLILLSQSQTACYLFSLAFGFTYIITGPITTTLLGRLYGFTHIGLISGVVTMGHHFGGGLWAFAGGLIFDWTGSYRMSFVLSAVMNLAAFLCSLMIRERRSFGRQ
jgi:MFS family permease